jgi:hypothetical protein
MLMKWRDVLTSFLNDLPLKYNLSHLPPIWTKTNHWNGMNTYF